MLKKQKKEIEEIRSQTNEPIFKFINPKSNDIFSDMNGLELQELLYHLENYYLELRNNLNLNKNITFGIELEVENANINQIENNLLKTNLNTTWKTKYDNTIKTGIEINSPILKDNYNTWNELKTVCTITKKNASIGKNCGGHIHIGKQILDNQPQPWLNLFKLWSVYENIIYRFSYGDYLDARPSMKRFAKPMSKKIWETYQTLTEINNLDLTTIIESVTHERNQAINFYNVIKLEDFIIPKNTIEFRCPNGTLDPVIWQNNVNFFVSLLTYCQSSRYNNDIIEERRNINQNKYSSLEWYKEIYLIQALELCDMLFTNNLDKLYFLRQYLKSFDIGTKELEKAKPFTRTLHKY